MFKREYVNARGCVCVRVCVFVCVCIRVGELVVCSDVVDICKHSVVRYI